MYDFTLTETTKRSDYSDFSLTHALTINGECFKNMSRLIPFIDTHSTFPMRPV